MYQPEVRQECREVLEELVAGKLSELEVEYDDSIGFSDLGENSQYAEMVIEGKLYRINVQLVREVEVSPIEMRAQELYRTKNRSQLSQLHFDRFNHWPYGFFNCLEVCRKIARDELGSSK